MALENEIEAAWNTFREGWQESKNVNKAFVDTTESCLKLLAKQLDLLRNDLDDLIGG